MKASFQIAECSFAFAKILQKSEIAKRFATFFYIIPHFFLRNQNIHRIFAERICRKNLQKGGWRTKSYLENIGD